MKIKLDENLPDSVTDILAGAGHDVDTVPDEGLRGANDPAKDAPRPRTSGTEAVLEFDRIIVEADKLEGRPCIRGLRITVETVVRLVSTGWSFEQILEVYPDLERDDIQQVLEYAAAANDVHVYRLRFPA